jgi:hypothetical protein
MRTLVTLTALSILLTLVRTIPATAQAAPSTTRFTISVAPMLSVPRGEFRHNVGKEVGGLGGLSYRLDRLGFVSLRFDGSAIPYGTERKRVPISSTVGGRILVDVTTTNWIGALSLGPEFTLPQGPVRPYVHAGLSRLFFRTTSSLSGADASESFAATTNHSDSTGAWFAGGGIRIPIASRRLRDALSLDFGVRYNAGGTVAYLHEGSIRDNPDGTISFTPLMSRTPQTAYTIGVRIQIPYKSAAPCSRFLC